MTTADRFEHDPELQTIAERERTAAVAIPERVWQGYVALSYLFKRKGQDMSPIAIMQELLEAHLVGHPDAAEISEEVDFIVGYMRDMPDQKVPESPQL